ncbi:alternate-type signal peptide domain-containing protein [Aeromicrobium sp.]|uniref:alternate-type signal peptide domain-containing protein n=1 Tax=Aeromicrobium sp. TaxID=1871063 RepID=UPI0030BAD4BE
MKKSTKGAAAAAIAGILLLGGAGTLAYWTADTDVDGGDIASGKISLSTPDCGDGWTFDALEDEAGEAYGAGDSLVPGDVISKVCTFDITAVGNHLRASLEVTDASFTPANDLSADITADATYTIGGTAIPSEITETSNGSTVTATISVTFDPTSGDESQDLTTVLDDITVSAEQVHN